MGASQDQGAGAYTVWCPLAAQVADILVVVAPARHKCISGIQEIYAAYAPITVRHAIFVDFPLHEAYASHGRSM